MKVVISDYSNYDAERCFNGGNYSFHQVFEKNKKGMFEVSYQTSSEFDYCSRCGTFGHTEYNLEDCHFNDYQEVTEHELQVMISDLLYKKVEGYRITIDNILVYDTTN